MYDVCNNTCTQTYNVHRHTHCQTCAADLVLSANACFQEIKKFLPAFGLKIGVS